MTNNQNFLETLAANPKNVFLLDGLGALVSTLFLGVVLVKLEYYVGMPKPTLYLLALLAIGYAIYSLSAYFFLKKNWSPFLKVIAFANLIHCALTVFLIIKNLESLTALGIIYFVVEIIIVVAVAVLELKIAKQLSDK